MKCFSLIYKYMYNNFKAAVCLLTHFIKPKIVML